MARNNRHQFEYWALSLVGANPTEKKKGADHGIDGRIFFQEDVYSNAEEIIISVKSGKTDVSHVRDLVGVITREKAAIGVLITLQHPTKPMLTEAANAGFYKSKHGNHPKIQILTIDELFDGKSIDKPGTSFLQKPQKRAQRKTQEDEAKQTGLGI